MDATRVVIFVIWALVSSIASAQFQLQPGESIVSSSYQVSEALAGDSGVYFCEKCGAFHESANVSVVSNTGSGSIARNALSMLNTQRLRAGVSQLMPDAALQAVADRRAAAMAASGRKRHPPGSFAPGRYEGVGWSSSMSPSEIRACFTTDSRMQAAGAAMVPGRDGVYFCVVYR